MRMLVLRFPDLGEQGTTASALLVEACEPDSSLTLQQCAAAESNSTRPRSFLNPRPVAPATAPTRHSASNSPSIEIDQVPYCPAMGGGLSVTESVVELK